MTERQTQLSYALLYLFLMVTNAIVANAVRHWNDVPN